MEKATIKIKSMQYNQGTLAGLPWGDIIKEEEPVALGLLHINLNQGRISEQIGFLVGTHNKRNNNDDDDRKILIINLFGSGPYLKWRGLINCLISLAYFNFNPTQIAPIFGITIKSNVNNADVNNNRFQATLLPPYMNQTREPIQGSLVNSCFHPETGIDYVTRVALIIQILSATVLLNTLVSGLNKHPFSGIITLVYHATTRNYSLNVYGSISEMKLTESNNQPIIHIKAV